MLLIAVTLPLMAQHDGHQPERRKHTDITELVGDLSASQKRKVDAISRDSRERVDALRARQRAVRDSIGTYMHLEGDQSKVLYPLFDREARLQASISREMYATKLRIDEVLTREQRAELRKATAKDKK